MKVRLEVTRRRRASPLHAARAGIGTLWCITIGGVALSFEHPLLLGTVILAALAAGAAARVGRDVARTVAWAIPFAVVIAAVNALVVRDGITVVFRGATVPVLGRLDITAEALAYGGVLGLRAIAVFAAAALLAAAIDPDELLRAVRRRSLRAGVTAALATHLIPVLARDGRRLADAQRALTGGPPTGAARLGVLRAVTAGALDRATAAALQPRFSSGNASSDRTLAITTCVSGSWNSVPATAASSAGPCSRVSSPPQLSSPANVPPWKCGTRPAAARSSVDLPEPEPPASTTNSPGSTVRLTSRSAGVDAPG